MMPPRAALWIVERTLCADEREPVIGDLVEEYTARAAADGRRARLWLWGQALRSAWPNLRRKWRRGSRGRPRREGRSPMKGLVTDARFALRLMRRSPLAAAVGFISLGAALALNVLLVTLANAVLVRPLPVQSPAELAVLVLQRPANLMHNLSNPDYELLRDRAALARDVIAYSPVEASAAVAGAATHVEGEVVSGNFFKGLGVPLESGRGLTSDDDRRGAAPAVVVSLRFWRSHFTGGTPAGQILTLNDIPFTVVGVAAPQFGGMQLGNLADFWVPLAHSPALAGGDLLARANTSWLTVMLRVPRAQPREAVRQELDSILAGAFRERGRPVEPVVLLAGGRGDSALPRWLEGRLAILLAAGALVLLVGCLNVASLQMSRMEARRHELAVRTALGAGRTQLVRLLMIDALLLAAVSGAMGVAAAAALKDRAASLIALFGQPVSLVVPIDLLVVTAACGLSLLAALAIGLLTSWHVLRGQPVGALQEARTAGGPPRRLQRGLVVAQIAVSMALLAAAALLGRTLDNLRSTDLGFETRRVALAQVSPNMARLSGPAAVGYLTEVERAVRGMPGVESAAVASVMPLDFGGSRTSVEIAGYTPHPDEDMELNVLRVSPSYFSTMGIPLLAGRVLTDADRADRPRRIVVNETMARRFWKGESPVGRFVRFGSDDAYDIEVVGVVADTHYRMVREAPRPSFYVHLAEWPARTGAVHVRFAGDPAARLDELRRVVGGVNAGVPVTRVSTLVQQIERNIADERLAGVVGATLAAATLLLAGAGLYSTMAFLVGRRTREIGVRVALGARTRDLRRMVLRDAALLVVPGLACGVALAAWIGPTLRGLLYGVEPHDPVSVLAAAGLLAATALAASWIPARRAALVDPLEALRE